MPLERTKHVNGRMWQPGPSGNPNGRPSRLSGCPKFSGATSRRETLSRSRVVFRGCSAAWADLYSLPGFFAFVTAVDRMGCWSPCPAARQRRLLLRAGVVASGHVTALDPPRGPYLPREVSAAAAGPAEEAGPNRRAHSLLFRSRAIARGLRRQPYLLRRHPLPSRAAA
jgi:hypothetical protein